MQTDYDIVIVGAGMVGATLACALSGSGLRTALVDRARPVEPGDDYALRVSAVTRASEQVFRALAAWDGMAARRVSPFREMQVWDAGGTGEIHFDCADIGEPHLGHIVENDVIACALHQRLDAAGDVVRVIPAAVTALGDEVGRITATLDDGRVLSARLVVGADGARSVVRRHAGIASHGWSYDQKGIVATVRTELPHAETAWQRFLPTGPLAFLPLADGRCSIVWSNTTGRADELLALDDAAFCLALQEAFESRLGRVIDTGPRAAFPLALSHADSYVRPRLALVGDAAHTVHPLAGQGMNLGVADAAALAEVVVAAHRRRRDSGELAVLRRYERWRKGENLLMMGAMDGFKRLFGTTFAPLRLTRNLGLRLFDTAVPAKNLIMRRAMGLEGDLPRLARGG